ncbi:MAG: hypothetical protein PUP92_29295 [Rhizonema sp. PD38]|nr:hypothetical protein [Rhizonema sp. PD38]
MVYTLFTTSTPRHERHPKGFPATHGDCAGRSRSGARNSCSLSEGVTAVGSYAEGTHA